MSSVYARLETVSIAAKVDMEMMKIVSARRIFSLHFLAQAILVVLNFLVNHYQMGVDVNQIGSLRVHTIETGVIKLISVSFVQLPTFQLGNAHLGKSD